jgi:hypothetical protein
MGLELEDVEAGERRKPIASYVPADWQSWLLHHRVELNAMTTPQFIAWLDGKMATFGNGKLVPPATVLIESLSGLLDDRLHRQITEEILREAGIEDRVAAALRGIALPVAEALRTELDGALAEQPEASWRAALEQTADRLLSAQAIR